MPRSRLVLAAAVTIVTIVAVASLAAVTSACTLEAGETRAVARVLDAETLVLDDGREVRLIGALAPRHQDVDGDPDFWQPEADARIALEHLTAGRSVTLGYDGAHTDRNGRLQAHVFLEPLPGEEIAPPGTWLQRRMIETGHARAYVAPGHPSCATSLVTFERSAREDGLGLWQNAAYHVRAAEPPWPLHALRDRFAIVEGEVANAAPVRGQVYLNFGADWRTDFTVLIKPAQRRALAAAGIEAAALAGSRVRVRGWITRRNGPFIELADAAELEILDRPAAIGSDATGAAADHSRTERSRDAIAANGQTPPRRHPLPP